MLRVRRRDCVVLLAAIAAMPMPTHAQQPGKSQRLGILSQDPAQARETASYQAFQSRLRELGWQEQQNIVVEWRFSEGKSDHLPRLADELVELKVDAILAIATPAALAAAAATRTIPIVFVQVADPVALGIVAGLARPNANVTGLSNMLPDLGGKRLALVRELLPQAKSVAYLWNKSNKASELVLRDLESASQRIGLELTNIGVTTRDELPAAFAAAAGAGAAAIMLQDDTLMAAYLPDIVPLAKSHALPIFSIYAEAVDKGCLISYGPSRVAMYRRSADYVDRLLKGAKPGELPVEQPSRFEMVVNLAVAKGLGITIPESVLVQADRIIE